MLNNNTSSFIYNPPAVFGARCSVCSDSAKMETSVSSAFDSSAAAAAPTFAVSSKVSFVAFACQVGSARQAPV